MFRLSNGGLITTSIIYNNDWEIIRGETRLWNIKNDKYKIILDSPCVPLELKNGNIIAGCMFKDNEAIRGGGFRILDKNGNLLQEKLNVSEKLLYLIAELPNGFILSRYIEDRKVRVWNMTLNTIIYEIDEDHDQGEFGLAILKNGNFIMEYKSKIDDDDDHYKFGLKLFDMNSGKLLRTFDEKYYTNRIRVLENGNIILGLCHRLKVLDSNTFKEIQTIFTDYEIYFIRELSNGNILTLNEGSSPKKTIDIWELTRGRLLQTIDISICDDTQDSFPLESLSTGEIVCKSKENLIIWKE